MSKKFEVQEFNLCGGWINNWSDDDGASTFETKEQAEAELDWFLQEMLEAVEDGNMEDVPDREDFRIVEVA
jgi:hypothetical protein